MNINAFLDYASKQYYAGTPVISDEEFDALAEKHRYKAVGSNDSTDIEHIYRLYSLQKVFKGENKNPLLQYSTINCKQIESPKLDGAAVALVYYKGEFLRAVSRGDGKKGKDVSNNVRHLVPKYLKPISLPIDIPEYEFIQISGEIVAPKEIPNARNYAAGALGLKDETEFLSRTLRFIAYSINPYHSNLWTGDMALLSLYGFDTVLGKEWNEYPQDGVVIRLDKNDVFEEAGHTDHHPRGAYALKERPEGVRTTLLDVIWQVGKSGVVSPVAILDPIKIGEATISRATLHNMAYIEALGLEIGCDVEVIRSGEIIPRVVRKL